MLQEPISQAEALSSEKARKSLTLAFFQLASHWQLTNQQTAALLGWNYSEKRSRIDSMRRGDSAFDFDLDKLERVIDLVNIHKSLRVLFPNDRKLVYQWVHVVRERFGNHSALDVMLESGRFGIAAIRHYLDHERSR